MNCDILDNILRDKACGNASHDSLSMCAWGRVKLQTYHIHPYKRYDIFLFEDEVELASITFCCTIDCQVLSYSGEVVYYRARTI